MHWSDLEPRFNIKDLSEPLVVYHADCSDGISAAWCFCYFFGAIPEYFPGVYNGKMPIVEGRDIFLVDFSWSPEVLMYVCSVAKSVTIIDHHKTAIDSLENFESPNLTKFFSNDRSGATLTWLYLTDQSKTSDQTPFFLDMVEDRDLWNFKYTNTKPLMASFFSDELTLDRVSEYVAHVEKGGQDYWSKLEIGRALIKAHDSNIKKIINSNCRTIELFGKLVPLVNCNFMYASDVGNELGKGELYSITYSDTESHRVFSLRSRKDESNFDVSEIAKSFGGGGHRNAAGFKVPRDHALAMI